MRDLRTKLRPCFSWTVIVTWALTLAGCGPHYRELRRQGQTAMLSGSYAPARYFFQEADALRPRRVDNLHDLGACSVMIARRRFEEMNRAAAMRELDAALGFYSQALDVYPGHQASIEGKTQALELKGRFDEALEHAEWAVEFVGPSAKQYMFLAKELEERGDVDGALVRYRQAVAVEPQSADAHVALARFLLRNDNESAAIGHLQAAYRLDPSDPWVLDQLAARRAIPSLADERARTP